MITRRAILAALGLSTAASVPAAASALSPDDRIDAACEEIKQALHEKHGWCVSIQNEAVPIVRYVGDGAFETVGFNRHVIVIDADSDPQRGSKVRWYVDHGGPLYAQGSEA